MKWYKRGCCLILFVSFIGSIVGCFSLNGNHGATASSAVVYPQEEALELQTQFNVFTDSLFAEELKKNMINLHFKIADPASYGITDYAPTLGEFSLDTIKSGIEEEKKTLEKLKVIDRNPLTPSQQITYDVLLKQLQTNIKSEGLELYTQTLSPTMGIQSQLPVLLAEYRFYSEQDVKEYLSILAQIKIYFGEIIEFEKQKADAGLFMSDDSVDHIIASCNTFIDNPENNMLIDTFNQKLQLIDGVDNVTRATYVEENRRIIKDSLIPAYEFLIKGLIELKGLGKNEKGLSGFEDGKRYYEYLVAKNTGSEHSVKELKKMVQKQLNHDVSFVSKEINKTPGLNLQMEQFTFGQQDSDTILNFLKEKIGNDFPDLPEVSYTIKEVPVALEHSIGPAFYLVPPIDNYKDNIIYINKNKRYESSELYPLLAHEGYPGHLYQTVYFNSVNDSNIRSILKNPGYVEGWATYVEYYSYLLSETVDSQLAQVMSYNSSSTMALFSLLDIHINYDGWGKEETADYLSTYYGIKDRVITDEVFYKMVEEPTSYLQYYVGYLEIIALKEKAEKTLKSKFNLKEFHKFILDMGPAPFGVIDHYMDNWLKTQI